MINNTSYHRINHPTVLSEVIDGEAIIVNLDSGAYYSLRDTGSTIWSLIMHGANLDQIIEQMTQQYDGDPQIIEAGVRSLTAELKNESLICPLSTPPESGFVAEAYIGEKLPFQKPILEKFTDMADLLLLDPIHEVDEAGGWPNPAPAKTL